MNIQEGKIKVDLKRIMTRIMGALEFKTDPKARQEIIAAIKGELEEILPKHGYVLFEAEDHEVGMAHGQLEAICDASMELQDKIGNEEKDLPGWIQSHITSAYEYIKQANDNFHELKESDFYNITPDKLGGMGPITLPGVDTPGSGDVPASVGSAKDRYEEEGDKRKKKNKKKRILEFSEFVKEQKQQTAFAPEQPKKEMLGKDEYEVGPSNDPDEEMRERAKHINKARNVITLRDF